MNQGNPAADLSQILVGEWDAYSPGMAAHVVFSQDGQYRNTLVGGMQYHWGRWSVVLNGGALVVHFDLQGAEPKYFVGPLGSVPINWPSSENWLITNFQPNQVDGYNLHMMRTQLPTSYGSMGWMTNQVAPPPMPSPPPAAAAAPAWDSATMEKMRKAQEEIFKTSQEMHAKTQAAYDKANKAWSDYFKS